MLSSHEKLVIILFAILIWDTFWKGFALWRASQKQHRIWFIVLLVTITIGLLPIFYILWFPKEDDD